MAFTLFAPEYGSVAVIRCSPPSWMVHIALEEKGAPYDVRWLSFSAGEHRSPEMLARNPRGTIPVLEHDGVVVYETFAILDYLDRALPSPPLLPPDLAGRGRALTRFHESSHLKEAGMALFAALMRGAGDAERLAALGAALEGELARWERVIPEDGWLAGSFGLPDVAVIPYMATAVQLGLDLAALGPRLAAYARRARERPSVQRTWPGTFGPAAAAPLWRAG